MRGARIIIADIDAEKIARTRERLADTPARELECLVSDCDPLPLADATATRVVSTEVIEHVDDPRQFLAELVRVGQPGALYLLSVPHPTSEDLQKDFAADEYFRKPNHIRVLGEQFAALVREAGLEILSHSRYGFYWSLWMLFWGGQGRFRQSRPSPPRTLGQDLAGAARLAARPGHQAGPGRRGRQEPGDHRAQARPGVEPPEQFRYSRAEQLPGPPNCSVQLPRGCP